MATTKNSVMAQLNQLLPKKNRSWIDRIFNKFTVGQLIELHMAIEFMIENSPVNKPIPLLLWCPQCHHRHIDAEKVPVHRTHACQCCGHLWAPAVVPTVGVRFLPGCKNDGR